MLILRFFDNRQYVLTKTVFLTLLINVPVLERINRLPQRELLLEKKYTFHACSGTAMPFANDEVFFFHTEFMLHVMPGCYIHLMTGETSTLS